MIVNLTKGNVNVVVTFDNRLILITDAHFGVVGIHCYKCLSLFRQLTGLLFDTFLHIRWYTACSRAHIILDDFTIIMMILVLLEEFIFIVYVLEELVER